MRAVVEFLYGLREQGYKVLHDIPADEFNLDHVVVAPYGVYLIETKTKSLAKWLSASLREFTGKTFFVRG